MRARRAARACVCASTQSSKPARLSENLNLNGFELSDDEMRQLATLDKHRRYNDPGVFCEGMGVFCPIYD